MSKVRGFEPVSKENRKNEGTPMMPTRADFGSAGYDIYAPCDIEIPPFAKTLIFTDVKAYMLMDEVLELHVRSSMGIKHGLMLSNTTGIIDSTYYDNPGNEGNIGLPLFNTSALGIKIKKGERICQAIFQKYLLADNDVVASAKRIGGMGSSGK